MEQEISVRGLVLGMADEHFVSALAIAFLPRGEATRSGAGICTVFTAQVVQMCASVGHTGSCLAYLFRLCLIN